MSKTEFSYSFKLRTRYSETDQMGFVYYGRFAEYYEIGRVETFRTLGFSYKEIEEQDHVIMPVMSLQVRYLRPAYYDQLIEIKTSIRQIPDDTVIFFTEIRNETNQLINAATVKLCFLDAHSKARVKCPAKIIEALSHVIKRPDT